MIASYSVGEIQDPVERDMYVKNLLKCVSDKGVLILLEPGSPVRFVCAR